MIPLAQYLSDMAGEEFVPLRAPERRAPALYDREAHGEIPVLRPLKAHPVAPAARLPVAAVLAPLPEPSVPQAEFAAAKAAWGAEKVAIQEAASESSAAALRQREAELRAELAAKAEAQVEAIRAEMAVRHNEALALERERWTSAEADRLADLMILQMAVFEDTVRATVRQVLKPLAIDARQRRALEDLADAVRVIAPEGAEYRIAATGPSDLLAKFRERLGDKAHRLVVKPDESRVDLKVEADQTVIETRLSSWGRALEKALS